MGQVYHRSRDCVKFVLSALIGHTRTCTTAAARPRQSAPSVTCDRFYLSEYCFVMNGRKICCIYFKPVAGEIESQCAILGQACPKFVQALSIHMAGMPQTRLCSLLKTLKQHVTPGCADHLQCLASIPLLQCPQRSRCQFGMKGVIQDDGLVRLQQRLGTGVHHFHAGPPEPFGPFAIAPAQLLKKDLLDAVFAEDRHVESLS